MEFKVSKRKADLEAVAETALAQIEERDYIHKFEPGIPILCIGISFYKSNYSPPPPTCHLHGVSHGDPPSLEPNALAVFTWIKRACVRVLFGYRTLYL